jgi:hypothetical protein
MTNPVMTSEKCIHCQAPWFGHIESEPFKKTGVNGDVRFFLKKHGVWEKTFLSIPARSLSVPVKWYASMIKTVSDSGLTL